MTYQQNMLQIHHLASTMSSSITGFGKQFQHLNNSWSVRTIGTDHIFKFSWRFHVAAQIRINLFRIQNTVSKCTVVNRNGKQKLNRNFELLFIRFFEGYFSKIQMCPPFFLFVSSHFSHFTAAL